MLHQPSYGALGADPAPRPEQRLTQALRDLTPVASSVIEAIPIGRARARGPVEDATFSRAGAGGVGALLMAGVVVVGGVLLYRALAGKKR